MDSYKILYQGRPSSAAAIYTVPERAATSYTLSGETVEVEPSSVVQNVQTLVTQMIICDSTGAGETISIYLVEDSSTAAGVTNIAFNALTIGASATVQLKLNWPLSAGNTIRVAPTAGDIATITLFGIEVK